MAKNDNVQDLLKDIADAIRAKKGTSELINPQEFSSEIASIQSGGGNMGGGDDMVFMNIQKVMKVTQDELLPMAVLTHAVYYRGGFVELSNTDNITYYLGPAGNMYIQKLLGKGLDGDDTYLGLYLDRPYYEGGRKSLESKGTLRDAFHAAGLSDADINSTLLNITLEQFLDPNYVIEV